LPAIRVAWAAYSMPVLFSIGVDRGPIGGWIFYRRAGCVAALGRISPGITDAGASAGLPR
jgi:hypothetical protein